VGCTQKESTKEVGSLSLSNRQKSLQQKNKKLPYPKPYQEEMTHVFAEVAENLIIVAPN
jgi:hypothetical protein